MGFQLQNKEKIKHARKADVTKGNRESKIKKSGLMGSSASPPPRQGLYPDLKPFLQATP